MGVIFENGIKRRLQEFYEISRMVCLQNKLMFHEDCCNQCLLSDEFTCIPCFLEGLFEKNNWEIKK